jgi:flagellar basal body rod protein FlgB
MFWKHHLEDLEVEARIILSRSQNDVYENRDRIKLGKNVVHFQAFVKIAKENFRKLDNALTSRV